jgi:hypothetical protein
MRRVAFVNSDHPMLVVYEELRVVGMFKYENIDDAIQEFLSFVRHGAIGRCSPVFRMAVNEFSPRRDPSPPTETVGLPLAPGSDLHFLSTMAWGYGLLLE